MLGTRACWISFILLGIDGFCAVFSESFTGGAGSGHRSPFPAFAEPCIISSPMAFGSGRYKHEAADYHSPIVWILKDDLVISEDKIAYARNYVSDIRISNEFADLDIKGRLEISQNISNIDIV